jgi:exodeoxyribonuclease VII small subunit
MAEQDKPAPSFEASLAELEAIVKQLEGGDLPLESAIELFEKGVALSEACRRQLEAAETRVEMLIKRNNRIEAEPFQPKES